MSFWLGIVLGVVIGYQYGWVNAHKTVARECERLGGFFVESKVFKCVAVDSRGEGGE